MPANKTQDTATSRVAAVPGSCCCGLTYRLADFDRPRLTGLFQGKIDLEHSVFEFCGDRIGIDFDIDSEAQLVVRAGEFLGNGLPGVRDGVGSLCRYRKNFLR